FAARWLSAVSVHEITREVGVSRASFYQYFSGKDQILLELREECRSAAREFVATLHGLGPTREGFVVLRQCIEDWAHLYDHYLPIVAECSVIGVDGQRGSCPLTHTITALRQQLALILSNEE